MDGTIYAAISDITALGVVLTADQQEAAEFLLEAASAKLRLIAKNYNRDLDKMITGDSDVGTVVKAVVCKAVIRALNNIADNAPAAIQTTQSALGYSQSLTYLNAGQDLYFLNNELKDIGIRRQTFGALEVYGSCSEA